MLNFSILFFSVSSLINLKNQKNKSNLLDVAKSNEFTNLSNYFIYKINSPYQEIHYLIKNITTQFLIDTMNIRN